MAVLYTNNATSALSASITNVATSMSVTAGQGALFPAISGSDYFYVTLVNNSGTYEIVKVTARATDTFTIVRGQDGTTGTAFSAGDKVELRVTKGMLDALKTDVNAVSGNLSIGGANSTTSDPAGDLFMPTDSELVYAGQTGNITVNATWNSGWKYITNNPALRQKMTSTGWEFYTATTGTAGAAITFGTAKATLDLSGNLAVAGTITATSFSGSISSSMVTAALGGTPPKVTMSETAPSTPTAGDLWWNSGTGVMYIYFTDIDSTSQWVDISSSNAVSSSGGGVSTGKAIAMSMVFGF
jgi:hypothetical protein